GGALRSDLRQDDGCADPGRWGYGQSHLTGGLEVTERLAPPLQEAPFSGVVRASDRSLIRALCLDVAAEAAQEVGPDRVEEVVVGQVESLYRGQRLGGSLDLGDGNRTIERRHGARRDRHELIIQLQDLSPIGLPDAARIAVDRIDGCLNLVRPGPVTCNAQTHQLLPLADEIAIPAGTVLVRQEDQLAIRGEAGGAAGVDEE